MEDADDQEKEGEGQEGKEAAEKEDGKEGAESKEGEEKGDGDGEEEKSESKKRKGPEPSSFSLSNSSRVTPEQEQFVSFNMDQRYIPINPRSKPAGIVVLIDRTPDEEEDVLEVEVPTNDGDDDEADPPEPFEVGELLGGLSADRQTTWSGLWSVRHTAPADINHQSCSNLPQWSPSMQS